MCVSLPLNVHKAIQGFGTHIYIGQRMDLSKLNYHLHYHDLFEDPQVDLIVKY